MVVAVWSVKGGVGVTSVAALLAMSSVAHADETLLVDLTGDVPPVLGIDTAVPAGVVDWCRLDVATPAALQRIETLVRPGLSLLSRGASSFVEGDGAALSAALLADRRRVIVDCGVVDTEQSVGRDIVERADESFLVARGCFLTLNAIQRSAVRRTGVVLVKEPRRYLGRADVELAAKAPVVVEVAADWSIARAIDVGLARAALPRRLMKTMGKVLDHAA